jgi:hypothetical protein
MAINMKDLARRFVELALSFRSSEWKDVTWLPDDKVQILFDVIYCAGFNPERVVPGKLTAFVRDYDGSRTGHTFLTNVLCPYKVIDQRGHDDHIATAWLDMMFSQVVSLKESPEFSHEKLVEMVYERIERHIPLEPIRLTLDGDYLCEYSSSDRHLQDDSELDLCIGVHQNCNGFMDRHRATNIHDAISCRKCYLRIVIPREIKTYGDLRRAMIQILTKSI